MMIPLRRPWAQRQDVLEIRFLVGLDDGQMTDRGHGPAQMSVQVDLVYLEPHNVAALSGAILVAVGGREDDRHVVDDEVDEPHGGESRLGEDQATDRNGSEQLVAFGLAEDLQARMVEASVRSVHQALPAGSGGLVWAAGQSATLVSRDATLGARRHDDQGVLARRPRGGPPG